MTHFVSTVATPSRCPRCRTPILTALDEGLTARVDLAPLRDRQAEIAALLTGRRTYNRLNIGHLVYRDATRIAGNSLAGTVHAEHQCDRQPQQLTLWSNKC